MLITERSVGPGLDCPDHQFPIYDGPPITPSVIKSGPSHMYLLLRLIYDRQFWTKNYGTLAVGGTICQTVNFTYIHTRILLRCTLVGPAAGIL